MLASIICPPSTRSKRTSHLPTMVAFTRLWLPFMLVRALLLVVGSAHVTEQHSVQKTRLKTCGRTAQYVFEVSERLS